MRLSEGIRIRLNERLKIATARSLICGVLLVALLGPLGAATSAAHADPNDEKFLEALHSQGIDYRSAAGAIASGHAACRELEDGRAASDVAQDVMNSSNLDGFHAGYFVGASIGAYCRNTPRSADADLRLQIMRDQCAYYRVNTFGRMPMITKALVGIVAVFVGLGLAAPAQADPPSFNDISCSCPAPAPAAGPTVLDQINQGIHKGLSRLGSSRPAVDNRPDRKPQSARCQRPLDPAARGTGMSSRCRRFGDGNGVPRARRRGNQRHRRG